MMLRYGDLEKITGDGQNESENEPEGLSMSDHLAYLGIPVQALCRLSVMLIIGLFRRGRRRGTRRPTEEGPADIEVVVEFEAVMPHKDLVPARTTAPGKTQCLRYGRKGRPEKDLSAHTRSIMSI